MVTQECTTTLEGIFVTLELLPESLRLRRLDLMGLLWHHEDLLPLHDIREAHLEKGETAAGHWLKLELMMRDGRTRIVDLHATAEVEAVHFLNSLRARLEAA
jgi:hypothetical protein